MDSNNPPEGAQTPQEPQPAPTPPVVAPDAPWTPTVVESTDPSPVDEELEALPSGDPAGEADWPIASSVPCPRCHLHTEVTIATPAAIPAIGPTGEPIPGGAPVLSCPSCGYIALVVVDPDAGDLAEVHQAIEDAYADSLDQEGDTDAPDAPQQ